MMLPVAANIFPAEDEKCLESCVSNYFESRIRESVLPFFCNSIRFSEGDAADAVKRSAQRLKYSIIRSNMSN